MFRAAPNVLALGMTSLLTDVSSEMVTSILPMYLMLHLQLSPLGFGAIDGMQQAGASLLRLGSGVLADRSRRYRAIAATGYGVSALCKLGLLLAGTTAFGVAALTFLDRLGKGLRSSPRDALISLSVPPAELGRAFGLHRTFDTAGALLGPLVAFGALSLAPGAYDAVFAVSFAIALIGVGVIVCFVSDPAPEVTGAARAPAEPGLRSSIRQLLGRHGLRVTAAGAGAIGLITVSDSFIYLLLQQRLQFDSSYLPLLYVATPLVYMLLALPLGWLSDRVGRVRVFLLGHGALLACYVLLLLPVSVALTLPFVVLLLGGYYAATDGVLMALSSALLPSALRGSGIALVSTVNLLGRLLASVCFGFVWSRFDIRAALVGFFVAGLLVLVWLGVAFRPATERARRD